MFVKERLGRYIPYRVLFTYAADAREAYKKGDQESYKQALRKAQETVTQLRDALDFNYPIAKELYPLYQFALRQLSACFYRRDTEGLDNAEKVLRKLYVGFTEAAKQDHSEPLMKHTQQVVAGMTYQKGNLTETLQDSDISRGFFA